MTGKETLRSLRNFAHASPTRGHADRYPPFNDVGFPSHQRPAHSYNRDRYIAEAIESVLAQTVTDFELIVSDDQIDRRNPRDHPRAWRGAHLAHPRVAQRAEPRGLRQPPPRRGAPPAAASSLTTIPDDAWRIGTAWQRWSSRSKKSPGRPSRCHARRLAGRATVPDALTPRLAYEREFRDTGCSIRPASALFRTEVSARSADFPEIVLLRGDDLFWLRRVTVNVLLASPATCSTTGVMRTSNSPNQPVMPPTRARRQKCGACSPG